VNTNQPQQIADFFIRLRLDGQDAVNKAIDDLEKKVKKAGKDDDSANGGIFSREWARSFTDNVTKVSAALAPLTARFEQMAYAGLASSQFGHLFGMQFQELARQIGSVFVPTATAGSEALQKLIGWFQGLSGDGQAGIRWTMLFGLGLSTAAATLPRIISGLEGVVGLLKMAKDFVPALAMTFAGNPVLASAIAIGGLATVGMAQKSGVGLGDVLSGAGHGLAGAGHGIAAFWGGLGSMIGRAGTGVADFFGMDSLLSDGRTAGGAATITGGKDKSPSASQGDGGRGWYSSYRDRLETARMNKTSWWDAAQSNWNPLFAAGDYFAGYKGLPEHLGGKPTKGQDRNELPPQGGGWESMEQTYRRIASTAVNVGVVGSTFENKMEEITATIASTLTSIRDDANNRPPPVVGGR
jgi:hypothetical protein